MQSYVSYSAKILNQNKVFNDTLLVYREALSFLIKTFNKEWNSLSLLSGNDLNNASEKLVHSTKDNNATYPDFDKLFYKFPSYLRRSAVSEALGIVSSYRSNLKCYEENKSYAKGHKKPVLQLKHTTFPVFYKQNMFLNTEDDTVFCIKIYYRKDWVWCSIKLRQQDINYLKKRNLTAYDSPTLEKRGRSFYLRFPFKLKTEFKSKSKVTLKELKHQKIVSVDLNVKTSAVCSVIDAKGTVHDRLFINPSREKDHLYHALNLVKKKQNQGGLYAKPKKLWAYINHINKAIADKTAKELVSFAVKNNAEIIVFENLNFKGKKRFKKNMRQRLQMWNKIYIKELTTSKAHREGIRISTINPSNTSKLAFDGSGYLTRHKDNTSLCTFKSGKHYNTDLNASYNIGARYFLRAYRNIIKTTLAKEWSLLIAKVPSVEQSPQSTLSTLINFYVALSSVKTA